VPKCSDQLIENVYAVNVGVQQVYTKIGPPNTTNKNSRGEG